METNIKVKVQDTEWKRADEQRPRTRFCENTHERLDDKEGGEFFDYTTNCQLLKQQLAMKSYGKNTESGTSRNSTI
jgi:hypothetical protein